MQIWQAEARRTERKCRFGRRKQGTRRGHADLAGGGKAQGEGSANAAGGNNAHGEDMQI